MAGIGEFTCKYGGLAAHYLNAHQQYVCERRTLASWGATIMMTGQTKGDWSDPPVPDLVVASLLSAPLDMTCDYGGGCSRQRMPSNSFIVVPPNYATRFLMEADHKVQFLCLPYDVLVQRLQDIAGQILPQDGDLGVIHSRIWQDRATLRTLRAMLFEARGGNPHGQLGADGLVLQLMAGLLALRAQPPSVKNASGLAPWQLRRVTERIDDDLSHDLSLRELANLVGLSPYHFCRAFRGSTGIPPHRWRLKRRVERAEMLLKLTGQPITSIAAELGFSTSQHFASAFKQATGLSPSAYRQACANTKTMRQMSDECP